MTQKELTHRKTKQPTNINNLRTNRKTTISNPEKENGKENNCMDTSSDKLRKVFIE